MPKSDNADYIISFENTHSAIKAESCLLAQRLSVGVMPRPSQISAGCGICLRIIAAETSAALEILVRNRISGYRLYLRQSINGRYSYQEQTSGV